jgi:hypothetical protein
MENQETINININNNSDSDDDMHYETLNNPPICYMTKKYTKKNGEITIKKYNQTQYNTLYYMNNKERLTEMKPCPCGGKYCDLRKYNHKNSKIHKLYERMFLCNN